MKNSPKTLENAILPNKIAETGHPDQSDQMELNKKWPQKPENCQLNE